MTRAVGALPELGSVITLKSGGPKMTVSELTPHDKLGHLVDCTWFDDHGVIQKHSFAPDILDWDDREDDGDGANHPDLALKPRDGFHDEENPNQDYNKPQLGQGQQAANNRMSGL